MVDLVASNLKLKQRSRNILRRLSTKCIALSDTELDALLAQRNQSVKLAILVAKTGKSVGHCQQLLKTAGGVLATALDGALKPTPSSVEAKHSRQYVLCIDGGGTKCAAVVAGAAGAITHGYAGPCNLYVLFAVLV